MTESLDVIIHGAHALLARLNDPRLSPDRGALFASVRPRDADYDRVFVPAVAASARAGYAGLWSAPPPWPVKPDQTELHVTAAYAEDFAADHPRAKHFPGGYKQIAGALVPNMVWLLWEFVTPGARDGIVFDGLVAVDDRWAWFPKPWRVVPDPV